MKERVVDDRIVGLHVAGEALEHAPDGQARMLRLAVEEHVVLVRERDEKVPLPARLALAVLETRRLDRHAGRVRRQAERGGDRFLARGLHDASEGRADVLGVATHRAAVETETEALAGALLLVAIERNAEEILHGCRSSRGTIGS